MFNVYMADQVVLIRKVGGNTWGEKATTRTTVKARVENENYLIRNLAGENAMITTVVYLRETDVLPSDRVEIDGVEHPILTIKKHKSFSRTVIMEIGIG